MLLMILFPTFIAPYPHCTSLSLSHAREQACVRFARFRWRCVMPTPSHVIKHVNNKNGVSIRESSWTTLSCYPHSKFQCLYIVYTCIFLSWKLWTNQSPIIDDDSSIKGAIIPHLSIELNSTRLTKPSSRFISTPLCTSP